MEPVLAAGIGAVVGAGLAALALRRSRAVAPEHVAGAVAADDTLLAELIDAINSAVVVVDEDNTVVLANPAAARLALVQGGRLAVPGLLGVVRDVRRTGTLHAADFELAAGPDMAAVHARVVPALRPGHVLLFLDDLTDARRVEAVRRDFVANVSHELKTPVGALSLLAEAVLGASDDPEAVRRFAERMSVESSRLARLVQELIDLSRLQGADPLPLAERVNVGAVLQEAAERVRAVAGARDIEVAVGDAEDVAVYGDHNQLVTAVGNLLDNAVAYSPQSTRVAVGARSAGGTVEISVADQGIGIAAEDQERIFERFYRVDPARSRDTGGTGLGLAIAKHVASNHSGRISVWSVEGSGSTFTLHLPAAVTPAEGGGGA